MAFQEPKTSYNSRQLRDLYNRSNALKRQLWEMQRRQHEIELQMFFLINEAAFRRDRNLHSQLALCENLGSVPTLALRHYKFAFGDASQLEWLLAEDAKQPFGGDSLIVLILGYMDEWDKTILRLKQHAAVADGAGAGTLRRAIRIRKELYGEERFYAAWNRKRGDGGVPHRVRPEPGATPESSETPASLSIEK